MPKGIFQRSEEHKRHIAEALKDKPKSEEHKRKVSEAKRGVPVHTDESRAKISQSLLRHHPSRGKVLSPEWKAKLSVAHKGKAPSLAKYGITAEEYAKQKADGNRWCWFKRHFIPEADFVSGTRGVCAGCKVEAERQSSLQKLCGVDQEWYEAKLSEQGGVCALCGRKKPSYTHNHLPVDHDHATGKPRGILCGACNTALHRVETIPDWGVKALAYLARYR